MSSSLRSAEQQGSVPGPAASLGPGLTTSLPGPAVSAGSGPAASLSGPAASLPGPAVSAGSGPAASSGLEPAASSLPGPAASPGQGLRASVDLGPAASSGLKELRCLLGHIRYENLAAGLSGGVISTLVLHPLDLVKIRFAVSDGLQMRPQYYGMAHCMRSIWQVEGFRGLYQGVTPNVWGAGASWGFYFLFYNAIKSYCQEGRQTELSALEHLLSAAEAGILTLCLTNPVWVTKTRLVLQYSDRKQYNGMMDAMLKIYQYEGIPGLYRGFLPGLLGTSQAALQFTTYEALKRNNNQYKKLPADALLSPWEYVVMAAVSKIIAVATTYPYQVVRARLQDQHNSYNGLADVVTRTWSNEGALGFYKGMVPNLVRVLPACCITFLVYENVSRLLLGQYK